MVGAVVAVSPEALLPVVDVEAVLARAAESDLLEELIWRQVTSRLQIERELPWRACWLHVAEQKTAKQVAEELGISENAVKVTVSEATPRTRRGMCVAGMPWAMPRGSLSNVVVT